MTNPRRPLVIDLDPGSGPPTGRICDAAGIAHPFTGWLGFASVLGQVLEQDRSARPGAAEPRLTDEFPRRGRS